MPTAPSIRAISDRVDAANAKELQRGFNGNGFIWQHRWRYDNPVGGDAAYNPELSDAYWAKGYWSFEDDSPATALKRSGDLLYIEPWGNGYERDDMKDERCWVNIHLSTFHKNKD